jgi:hypothetical protein
VSIIFVGSGGLAFFLLLTLCTFLSRIESEELKMLRVAVSSFYDYLAVVLKTMQEFDTTMSSPSAC